MVPIEETSHLLVTMLRALGNEYGPLGVALAAAQLSDPQAVVHHLTTWTCDHPADAVMWNEGNGVTQCHRCGHVTDRTPLPSPDAEHWAPSDIDGSGGEGPCA